MREKTVGSYITTQTHREHLKAIRKTRKLKDKININSLSKHLFWDVDPEAIDFEKNKRLIISRILLYGTISDWNTILKHYGIKTIADFALTNKELDYKTASFISLLSGISKKQFACYSTKQSIKKHWNF